MDQLLALAIPRASYRELIKGKPLRIAATVIQLMLNSLPGAVLLMVTGSLKTKEAMFSSCFSNLILEHLHLGKGRNLTVHNVFVSPKAGPLPSQG